MNNCLVIIPAYNEEKNIVQVLTGLSEFAKNVDIVVINDCSKDNTERVVKESGFKVISHCSNLGYSGAILTGLKYAIEKGYKYVIQFDGDGQHDPREVNKLIIEMDRTNSDIVIGSRFIKKSDYQHGSMRMIGTKIFTTAIKLITGKTITDPTSGLQILNKKTFNYYVKSGNYPEYPDANILILMLRMGFEIEEMPVIMHERLNGIGMHASPIKNIKYMISMFYSILVCLLKNKPKSAKDVMQVGV